MRKADVIDINVRNESNIIVSFAAINAMHKDMKISKIMHLRIIYSFTMNMLIYIW